MKQQFLLFFLAITPFAFGQQTGINTGNETSTERSAILEIKSTSGGFLIPRLTQTQRNAIANPATGLEVYNTTSNSYEIYNGTAWFSYNTKDANPPASSTVAIMSSWEYGVPVGKLVVNTPAGVTISLKVNVIKPGTYDFATTFANGVSFSATGTFSTTGSQTITLLATGTPRSVGTYSYVMKNVLLPQSFTFLILDEHTVAGAAGKIWMAYNLGATAVASAFNDYTQYGSMYQWGRDSDGHQLINWTATNAATAVNGSTSIPSTSDTPGHSDFIVALMASPSDWRSPQNHNLWQGVNGINNPCPAGFRIPTHTEWTNEVGAAKITDRATAYQSSLKITTVGFRHFNSLSFNNAGASGYYWTSTTNGLDTSVGHVFEQYNARFSNNARAFGFTVRCIKE